MRLYRDSSETLTLFEHINIVYNEIRVRARGMLIDRWWVRWESVVIDYVISCISAGERYKRYAKEGRKEGVTPIGWE